MVGDASFHDHVNLALHVSATRRPPVESLADIDQSEGIMEAKYACRHKGGEIEWQAAYQLAGARDLVSLERGAMASILNADSYIAFAASKWTFRGAIDVAADMLDSGAHAAC